MRYNFLGYLSLFGNNFYGSQYTGETGFGFKETRVKHKGQLTFRYGNKKPSWRYSSVLLIGLKIMESLWVALEYKTDSTWSNTQFSSIHSSFRLIVLLIQQIYNFWPAL